MAYLHPIEFLTKCRFAILILKIMEEYVANKEVKLFCTPIRSFPDSIQESFHNLETLLSREGRTFYGISHGSEGGKIIYKVAVTENFEGEGKKYGFESFVITPGRYLTETVFNWKNKTNSIADIFKRLLSDPRLDHSFPCVEWYKSDRELICMVRISQPRGRSAVMGKPQSDLG